MNTDDPNTPRTKPIRLSVIPLPPTPTGPVEQAMLERAQREGEDAIRPVPSLDGPRNTASPGWTWITGPDARGRYDAAWYEDGRLVSRSFDTEAEADAHVAGLVGVPRNIQDEREITALPFDGDIPWALVEMSEARAPDAPIRDLMRRDFCEETLEELADARNYIVWEIQKLEERGPVAGTSPARARLDQALRSIAISFALVQRAQQEIREERAA